MDFAKTFEDQLTELQTKFPQRNYDVTMLPESLARAYREEIMMPALISLIDRSVCKPGQTDAGKFEDASEVILKWTIGSEFKMPVVAQSRTLTIAGQSVRVRDISLTMPQGDIDEPWLTIRIENQIKSIVFECKNYVTTSKLTKEEIFQVYEYLHPKTYGKLGVILTRYGKDSISPSARSAIFRLAQDDYKIVVLGDDDMKDLINEFVKTGSCANFFAVHNEKARPQAG